MQRTPTEMRIPSHSDPSRPSFSFTAASINTSPRDAARVYQYCTGGGHARQMFAVLKRDESSTRANATQLLPKPRLRMSRSHARQICAILERSGSQPVQMQSDCCPTRRYSCQDVCGWGTWGRRQLALDAGFKAGGCAEILLEADPANDIQRDAQSRLVQREGKPLRLFHGINQPLGHLLHLWKALPAECAHQESKAVCGSVCAVLCQFEKHWCRTRMCSLAA